MGNFTITKREILLSIAIVCIMILFGIIISDKINDSLMTQYQEYNTALQIDADKDLFEYGMRTNVGNAFVYGELKAIDTVTYPEIDGEYSYIKKVKEKYTQHTRIVRTGKTTSVQVYYTWDAVGSESKHSKRISFLNVEFDYGTIEFPSSEHITTKKVSNNIRYVYYGTGVSYTGTLYANLKDDTISETTFYNNSSIDETVDSLESGWQLILFWVAWILLTGACVFGFYYIDNNWLEDKKQTYQYASIDKWYK